MTPRASDVHVVPENGQQTRDVCRPHFFEGGIRKISIESHPVMGDWMVIEFENGGRVHACLKHDTLMWEEPNRN